MFNTPMRFNRPHKQFDGEGAVETMEFASVKLLWGDPVVGEDGPVMVVPAEVDVRRGDIIEVPLNLYLWN